MREPNKPTNQMGQNAGPLVRSYGDTISNSVEPFNNIGALEILHIIVDRIQNGKEIIKMTPEFPDPGKPV